MTKAKRKDVILYLLYASKMEPISGRTRLQKLLFLLEKEHKLAGQLSSKFEFEAWKYGPFSAELLRDIEFLENVGLIHANRVGLALEPEKRELSILSDEYVDDAAEYSPDQLYAQEEFSLTDKGAQFVAEKIEGRLPKSMKEAIVAAKKKFNRLSLAKLLRYVYAKYPEYAIKSELSHYIT